MYREILAFLFFVGVVFIVIDVIKTTYKCPAVKTVYRYIPRTPEEEMREPKSVTDIFENMFSQPSAWMGNINAYDEKKTEEINKYFISQV